MDELSPEGKQKKRLEELDLNLKEAQLHQQLQWLSNGNGGGAVDKNGAPMFIATPGGLMRPTTPFERQNYVKSDLSIKASQDKLNQDATGQAHYGVYSKKAAQGAINQSATAQPTPPVMVLPADQLKPFRTNQTIESRTGIGIPDITPVPAAQPTAMVGPEDNQGYSPDTAPEDHYASIA